MAFLKEAAEYCRTIYGSVSYAGELSEKIRSVLQAIQQTPAATAGIRKEAERIDNELSDILYIFNGPRAKASWEEIPPIDMPLSQRLNEIALTSYSMSGDIPQIVKDQLNILRKEFPSLLERIRKAGEDMQKLDRQLDEIKAPWTPGRIPRL